MPLFANMKVSSWVMDFMGWRLRLCNPQSIFSGYCIWIKLHHVGRHSAEIRFRYLHLQETNLSSHLRIVLYVMMACLFVLQPSTFNPLSQAITFRYVCRWRPKAVSITSAMSWRFQVKSPLLHAHKNSDHEMTTKDQYIAVIPDLFAPRIQQHLKVL